MGVELLHHVQLAMPADGKARARECYAELLGIPRVRKPAASAGRGGGCFERGALREHLGVGADFRPARKAHPAFVVADLEAPAGRLRAAGYECRDDGEFKDYRRMFIFAPFGDRIELQQPRAASR